MSSKGFFVLSAMLLSRALDDSSFGALALFLSVGQVFLFFVDSGYSVVLNRKLSLAPGDLRKLLAPALGARISLALASLLSATAIALLAGLRAERVVLLGMILVAFSLEAVSENCFAVFRALERVGLESASRLLSGGMGLLFIVLVVRWLPGPGTATASYMFRSALMAIACILFLHGLGGGVAPSFRPGPVLATFRDSRHLWAMGMLMVCAQRLDTVVLRAFLSDQAVGAYQECYRIVDTLALVITPTLLPGSLFPRLCRAFEDGGEAAARMLGRIGSLVTGLALLAVPPLIAGGDGLMRLVWGPRFLRGQAPAEYQACYLLCVLAIPLVFWMNTLLASLLAAGRQRAALRGAAGGLAVNLGANLLLVPGMGPTGSALAMMITNAALSVFFAAGLSARERAGLPRELWRVLPGLAVSATVIALGRSLPAGVVAGASAAAFTAAWLPLAGLRLLQRAAPGPS